MVRSLDRTDLLRTAVPFFLLGQYGLPVGLFEDKRHQQTAPCPRLPNTALSSSQPASFAGRTAIAASPCPKLASPPSPV